MIPRNTWTQNRSVFHSLSGHICKAYAEEYFCGFPILSFANAESLQHNPGCETCHTIYLLIEGMGLDLQQAKEAVRESGRHKHE